jgi:hypothetical protein
MNYCTFAFLLTSYMYIKPCLCFSAFCKLFRSTVTLLSAYTSISNFVSLNSVFTLISSRFKFSGMLHHVEWYIATDVSEALNLQTVCHSAKRRIPGDLHLHQHSCKKLKSRSIVYICMVYTVLLIVVYICKYSLL